MKNPAPRPVELLAPATDKEVAKAAILHGADAVYIGASSHGARAKAANSVEDIRELVWFAHAFRARVYVTVNTLVYDHEVRQVEALVRDLYLAGVDALIVQDMALLRMNIPPIALHASTQCDTRTVAKARFLQQVGFSQLVLARELSVPEIRDICNAVDVPVECFIHGALCVSYSGRCGASQACVGRSANRGECAQMCRMPYTLRNARGEVLEKDRYLLSLRDFNASGHLEDLLDAGVSSFKIEGRLKDAAYVKNVTAYYRKQLDRIIAANPDRYRRASCGTSEIRFNPQLDKSFNRGFTDYFLAGRRPGSMASLRTPKSMGEVITDVRQLHNGDGISFFNSRGEYEGVNVNGISDGRIRGSRPFNLPRSATIHRTGDVEWSRLMAGETAVRTLWLDMEIDEAGLTLHDERGLTVRVALDVTKDVARRPMDPAAVLGKLGGTIYRLRNLENRLHPRTFIPASELARIRREAIALLDQTNIATYPYELRRAEDRSAPYPDRHLDPRSNVANTLAAGFYRDHAVQTISPALEVQGACPPALEVQGGKLSRPAALEVQGASQGKSAGIEVMTTRYCLLRELGACRRDCRDPRLRSRFAEPLTITTGPHTFRLSFDCARCEMTLTKV